MPASTGGRPDTSTLFSGLAAQDLPAPEGRDAAPTLLREAFPTAALDSLICLPTDPERAGRERTPTCSKSSARGIGQVHWDQEFLGLAEQPRQGVRSGAISTAILGGHPQDCRVGRKGQGLHPR